MRLKFLLILVGSMLVSGCIPIPDRHVYAPQIEGNITRNGEPVILASVELKSALTEKTSRGRSDLAGNFRVGPLAQFEMNTKLIGQQTVGYSLYVEVSGNRFLAVRSDGRASTTGTIRVKCELSNDKRSLACR
jgi:hypothetical protein